MKDFNFENYLVMSPSELRKYQWKNGWALSLIGLIVYGVLRTFKLKPQDYNGVCPYFEVGHGWGGVSLGWYFVCCKDAGEATKQHELGHTIQTAAFNGLVMGLLCIGSMGRYWWRHIFNTTTPYDAWWFEGQATSIGFKYLRNHSINTTKL